ncbi:hypothetical protein [Pseudomonas serbica]|uniref:hypothetical protein n=1 Tax=Pseudomonas serbica TaxID=2965074 RepID=UPI00237B6EA0|nr:hypothetical protein [Pseudomonas serbica]
METLARYVFALCVVGAAVMMVAPGLTRALPGDCTRGITMILVIGVVLSVVALTSLKAKKRKAILASMLHLGSED